MWGWWWLVGGCWLVGWLEFEMALSDNQNINSLQSIDNSFVAPPYYCTLLVLGHYGFYIYIYPVLLTGLMDLGLLFPGTRVTLEPGHLALFLLSMVRGVGGGVVLPIHA